ncbi:transposase [Halosquirtibacter xylanolyticus]|uniref:transposase n=1 Tax=Halosquirtibacter xylanolyticus TaxID=3374599 RepID=UPI0037495615|nr:transposase [Prolixibacteraceae bacterium]
MLTLQRYIIGCLHSIESHVEAIYINPDHLHILCTLPRTVPIMTLVTKIKSPSSIWMKKHGTPSFSWQGRYAIFSVSKSNLSMVKRYILNQPNHHKQVGYKEELMFFFNKLGIEYQEQYLWD